jgi:hypothetical protein
MMRATGIFKGFCCAGIAFVLMGSNCHATDDAAAAHRNRFTQQARRAPSMPQVLKSSPDVAQLNRAPAPPLDAKALQVNYEDGALTILAENTSLSEVLAEIRKVMGADIDIPASAAAERIWVRFGPGPARSVLRELLDGTNLDYVIQASETDEDGVRSVSLIARGKTAVTASTGSEIARTSNRHPEPVSSVPAEDPEPEHRSVSETAASEPTPPSVPSAAAGIPSVETAAGPAQKNSSLRSPTPLVGSSEQMAQQLQNLYQQRRQMQMQQNQKSAPSPLSN